MSALAINHNLMAANTANTLNRHYSNLATSTQRLSSGLRINSAADDAAGLAIRELQRADISALHQGARNTNDAISMIQTFDGALSVIDEKLIRMKELAEQAATGTYSSTQRLMIASEFEAMGSEINRIARATDFNGIKLIDGIDGVRVAAHAGGIAAFALVPGTPFDVTGSASNIINTGNGAITAGPMDLSGITDPAALGEGAFSISLSNSSSIAQGNAGQYLISVTNGNSSAPGTNYNITYNSATQTWAIAGQSAPVTQSPNGATWMLGTETLVITNVTDQNGNQANLNEDLNFTYTSIDNSHPPFTATVTNGNLNLAANAVTTEFAGNKLKITVQLDANNSISQEFTINTQRPADLSRLDLSFTIRDTTPPPPGPNPPGPGPNPPGPGEDPDSPLRPGYQIPDEVVRIHFGPGADSREDFYDIKKYDATLRGLGLEDVKIETQDAAQKALVQINDAITAKDKIRADYGAMQNRLENTLTSLNIQAENLQAAESRISDVDVATEMTNFVRNQILTQSAVAMLGQANSLPQMAMQLIG